MGELPAGQKSARALLRRVRQLAPGGAMEPEVWAGVEEATRQATASDAGESEREELRAGLALVAAASVLELCSAQAVLPLAPEQAESAPAAQGAEFSRDSKKRWPMPEHERMGPDFLARMRRRLDLTE